MVTVVVSTSDVVSRDQKFHNSIRASPRLPPAAFLYAATAVQPEDVFEGFQGAGDAGARQFHLHRPDGDVPVLPVQINAPTGSATTTTGSRSTGCSET